MAKSKLINCGTCEREIAQQAKVCPYCGDKNKMRGSKIGGFLVTLALVPLFIGGFLSFAGLMGASLEGALPTCDSTIGLHYTKGAIEDSPSGKTYFLKVIDFEGIREDSFNPEQGLRICEGTALTNGGRVPIVYSFQDRGNGEFWVEAQLIDTSSYLQ